jgi:hypothetical protein
MVSYCPQSQYAVHTDTLRAFLGQFPIAIIAVVLVEWKLSVPKGSINDGAGAKTSQWQKLKRIDFTGAFFLSAAILTALLMLDMGGQKLPWTHPVIIACGCAAVVCAACFGLVEAYWATEPIFPLNLITHYVVITSYSILTLQNIAQTAVCSSH